MATNQADFNNKAFVPYATDGNETTYIPNGEGASGYLDSKDDGYVKPFIEPGLMKHHEYENPAEVAKRAGLGRAGSGPRRKKNALYGDSKKLRVNLPETPTTPTENGAAECSPLVMTTPHNHDKKPRRRSAKVVIFLILLTLMSMAALALGLFNMLHKTNCSCSSRGLQVATVVEESRKPYNNELLQKLEALQNKYEELQKQMETQRKELDRQNKSFSLKPKVKDGVDGKHGPPGPPGAKGDIGVPGIKGDTGERGPGNMSKCIHKVVKKSQSVSIVKTATYKAIHYKEPQNTKVLSAVCSSTRGKGAGNTYLDSIKESDGRTKYTCHCAGTSIYGPFAPHNTIECVMHIWQCPLIS